MECIVRVILTLERSEGEESPPVPVRMRSFAEFTLSETNMLRPVLESNEGMTAEDVFCIDMVNALQTSAL